MPGGRIAVPVGLAAATLACVSCGAAPPPVPPARWTEAQAEAIVSVRGTPVSVRRCTGLGRPVTTSSGTFFARFRCLAGTRLPHEAFDTVAVTYVLHPLGRFRGASSRHALSDVHFAALSVP